MTNEMLEDNIIKRSTSVWNSPVVLVKKKDGSWRFAVDYRKLNEVTIPISQSLPRIEDVFDALGETRSKYFSTLDLNSAYFQIALDPESRHKSAFVTHEGVFEFTRMPFGLRNGTQSFQLLMSLVLKGLNWKFVLCYVDDILVFSPDFETHLHHLNAVFQRLRDANLTLKSSKCKFGVDRVVFLGHVLSNNGVSVDPSNTDKVQNFPVPRTQKELRGFLGLCKICVPLNALLKQEVGRTFRKTDWTEQCQLAFETLKTALVSPPILRFPDMNRQFILTTDASGGALSYILGQKDQNDKEYVVSYGGRAVRSEEKNWNTTQLECLALVTGIGTFKHYLSHRRFIVRTDHESLKWLLNKKEPTGKVARWSMKLQGYLYETEHIKGSKNQVADAISRIDYSRMPSPNQTAPVNTLGQDIDLASINFASLTDENKMPIPKSKQVESQANENQTKPPHLNLKTSDPTPPYIMQEFDNSSPKECEQTEVVFEYTDAPDMNTATVVADLHEIAPLQRECEDFKHIIKYLESNIVPENKELANLVTVVADNQYVTKDGVLYHIFNPRTKKVKDRNFDGLSLQVTQPKSERRSVLASYHDSKAGGGHFGIKRTFAAIKQKYWWPKMYQEVNDYIETCDVC